MDAAKIGRGLPLAKTHLDFLLHIIGCNPALQILHQLAKRGAIVVPAARADIVGIEIRKLAFELAKNIAKDGDAPLFLRLYHTQAYMVLFHAADVLLSDAGRTAEENRSCHTPCCHECAIACISPVELHRLRIASVNFRINDRIPILRQISDQLITDLGNGERNRSRHDHAACIGIDPKMICHTRHETKNAARLLESLDRRPLVIEEMKKFRMNRIAIHHLLLI